MRGHFRQYGVFWIVASLLLAALVMRGFAQEPATQGFFSWRREGLKAEVDALRTELDQLKADHDALVLKMGTLTSAATFSMAYQVERHQTLNNADFPIGYKLSDSAGTWHALTQAHKDALITATAKAETLYTALTTP